MYLGVKIRNLWPIPPTTDNNNLQIILEKSLYLEAKNVLNLYFSRKKCIQVKIVNIKDVLEHKLKIKLLKLHTVQ